MITPKEISQAPEDLTGFRYALIRYWRELITNLNASLIQWQDEGVDKGAVGEINKVNFTGAGVTATQTGSTLDVDIPGGGGGGVSDGDKGDITVSSSGATWTIDDDVVTFAKMQNVSTDILLGRDTAGTGDVEEITLGSRLSLSSNVLDVSDTWTYVKLGSDFTTSSATAVDVTGMTFTPDASVQYEIEGQFILRTATATVQPRIGVSWPSGMTDGVVYMQVTNGAAGVVMQNGNINASVLTPVGGLPNNTRSYPGQMQGTLISGGSPSGTFNIRLASETAATNVTMKAGSFIKYRTI